MWGCSVLWEGGFVLSLLSCFSFLNVERGLLERELGCVSIILFSKYWSVRV